MKVLRGTARRLYDAGRRRPLDAPYSTEASRPIVAGGIFQCAHRDRLPEEFRGGDSLPEVAARSLGMMVGTNLYRSATR